MHFLPPSKLHSQPIDLTITLDGMHESDNFSSCNILSNLLFHPSQFSWVLCFQTFVIYESYNITITHIQSSFLCHYMLQCTIVFLVLMIQYSMSVINFIMELLYNVCISIMCVCLSFGTIHLWLKYLVKNWHIHLLPSTLKS